MNPAIIKHNISHLSHSSIRDYLTDRQKFYKKWIRREFDEQSGPALAEGSAYHLALEFIWEMKKSLTPLTEEIWNSARERAMQHIIQEDEKRKIDYGKTGSLSNSIALVDKALGFYRQEMPEYVPVAIEQAITAAWEDFSGEKMPIKLKSKSDLICQSGEEIDIVDHKLVTIFHKETEPAPAFELQAAANFFTVYNFYEKMPRRMIFDQLKKSKNKDGSPQRKQFIINFFDENGEPNRCLYRFIEIFKRVSAELIFLLSTSENSTPKFLPNPFMQYGWEESWNDFCREVDGRKVEKIQHENIEMAEAAEL
jgi:hypothetical protein